MSDVYNTPNNWSLSNQNTVKSALVGNVAIPLRVVLFDAEKLRSYGATFDGVTDDAPAFQKAIDDSANQTTFDYPCILFKLPEGKCLFNTAVVSGSQHILVQGAGLEQTFILASDSNTTGVWIHGSSGTRSQTSISFMDLEIHDNGVAAKKIVAITGYWGDNQIVPTFRVTNVRIHYFYKAMYLYSPPRDINVINLTVYGPDMVIQDSEAITIHSEKNTQFVFTTTWSNCNVFNYRTGWYFLGEGMIEGHRFYGCTFYNGWNMVQAYVHADALASQGYSNYQAVIWYFNSCDYQGYGYCYDMHNCRGIIVDGGYYTLNARTGDVAKTLAAPWGNRTSATTNAMFDFYGCADVVVTKAQIDVSNNDAGDTVIAHFDNTTNNVTVQGNTILATHSMYGGFELGDPSALDVALNTMRVLENLWNWAGGDKVIDHGSRQIDVPWLEDNGYGSVTDKGFYSISVREDVTFTSMSVGSSGKTMASAVLTIPKRRYGNASFFTKTLKPVVSVMVEDSSDLDVYPIRANASDGATVTIVADSAYVGKTATIHLNARGQ